MARWNLSIAVVLLCCVRAGAAPGETIMLPMRDGTRLATDVHLPPGDGPFGVVLVRTVYGRASDNFGKTVTSHGLAAVLQDTRGYGQSEGERMQFDADGWGTHRDGLDTVEWIRRQPWCNGKIGTWGVSALGITQVLLAPTTDVLQCQAIGFAPSNLADVFLRGGVPQKQLSERYAKMMGHRDAFERRRAHPTYDNYWRLLDGGRRAPDVTVPGVHVGGWFDLYPQGAIDNFTARQYFGGPGARGNQKLIMGPWEHAITETVGDLKFPDYRFNWTAYAWRLFAHWIAGEPNGIMEEPAVHYYVMGDCDDPQAPGNEWRTAAAWPPFPTVATRYFLSANGALDLKPPVATDARRSFTFDPADPCPSLGGDNAMRPLPLDQRAVSSRKDVLSFLTEPLAAPVEVTGPLRVKLFVSSDAPDTDFSASLLDVYPNGRQIRIASGIQRVKFRGSRETPDPLPPGAVGELWIDCWSTSIVFNQGHRIGLHISSSNWPRYEINPNTGADLPAYLGENEQGDLAIDPASVRAARNTVYCDAPRPSALILPVRPIAIAGRQPDNRTTAESPLQSFNPPPRDNPVTNKPKSPRLTKPRIPPVAQAAWNDAQRALLQPIADKGRMYNVHSTLAAHPKMATAWMTFATYVLRDNSLPVRDREILILRIGRLCNAPYELAQHARIGRRAGLTDDDLRRIDEGPGAAGLSERDRLLLLAADELHEDAFLTDATWNALAKTYSTQQMMDLVFTVGEYNLVSMALNSFGVQLDEGLEPFPK